MKHKAKDVMVCRLCSTVQRASHRQSDRGNLSRRLDPARLSQVPSQRVSEKWQIRLLESRSSLRSGLRGELECLRKVFRSVRPRWSTTYEAVCISPTLLYRLSSSPCRRLPETTDPVSIVRRTCRALRESNTSVLKNINQSVTKKQITVQNRRYVDKLKVGSPHLSLMR